ncbi:MAG: histidine kinase, partial [Flavobacteriaceae bacterium]|nr:histidine kinase [Flavobacteriaceae bacterium]
KVKDTIEIPPQLNATQNFKDRDGFIWAATSEQGVYKLPISYDAITSYFEGKRIAKLTEIDEVVYVAVEEEGIYKLGGNKPKFWLKEKDRLHNISVLNESICYNFRFHLVVERGGVFKRIEIPDLTFGENLLYHKNSYFMEGNSGMSMLDSGFNFVHDFRDHHHPYYQGLFRQTDSIFSFSLKKMLYYDSIKDEFLAYKNERIQKKLLTITSFRNQTYIGTEGDGLYLFQDGKLQKLIPGDQAIINNISLENPNSIWAVSEGSLLHYLNNGRGGFSVQRFNQINGFPTNNVTDILIRDNRLYIGSTRGLNIINENEIVDTIDFSPYIEGIYVNGIKTQVDSTLFRKYDPNLSLKVNYGSINFFDSNHTTFRYRLDPIQSIWTSTESGEVNLYDLQPEEYTLQLQVVHNNESKTMSVPITIIPKWWQTEMLAVVLSLAVILILLLLLFFLLKYFRAKLFRERRLAQLELKALRSQMNPHFVHNSLNAIQYYIQRHEVELSEQYLAKFSKLIRQFFDYSGRQNISIKEEVNLLKNYLEIEKLRFEDKELPHTCG